MICLSICLYVSAYLPAPLTHNHPAPLTNTTSHEPHPPPPPDQVSKMESAKDHAKEAARSIRDKQREQQRMGSGMSGMSGIAGGSSVHYDDSFAAQSIANAYNNEITDRPMDSSSNISYGGSSSASARSSKAPVKGMSLVAAGGSKNKSLEDALVKEDKLAPVISSTSKSLASSEVAQVQPMMVQQPIMLVVAERILAKLSRDGMVESFEIKGSLTLTATTDEAALCSVQLSVPKSDLFTFNTHPKINKQVYDKTGLLQLKDAAKGFPSKREVGILRWTHASTSDELVPLKLNCWPEEESRGRMNVSIEYTMDLKMELHGVRIKIPLGTSDAPSIVAIDGSYKHFPAANEMVWMIDLIDGSNATGSLEFSINQRQADAFFPLQVQFVSQQLFCDLDVTQVRTADGAAPIQYSLGKNMAAEEYTVG